MKNISIVLSSSIHKTIPVTTKQYLQIIANTELNKDKFIEISYKSGKYFLCIEKILSVYYEDLTLPDPYILTLMFEGSKIEIPIFGIRRSQHLMEYFKLLIGKKPTNLFMRIEQADNRDALFKHSKELSGFTMIEVK